MADSALLCGNGIRGRMEIVHMKGDSSKYFNGLGWFTLVWVLPRMLAAAF